MSLRKTISLTALVCFVLLVVTSVVLYIDPAGRVAYWSGWRLWLLSKEQWTAVHLNLGLLLLVTLALHTWLNWPAILGYLKNRTQSLSFCSADFCVALLVSLLVCVGTLAGLPPFGTFVELGAAIADRANLRYGEPPYGHAELSPLATFAERVKLDPQQSMDRLRADGIRFDGPQQTLEQIARENGLIPRQLYEIMDPAQGAQTTAMPVEPPGGTGKRSLAQLCEIYRLDEKAILVALAQQGIVADRQQSLKEIGRVNNLDPHSVYAAVYQAAQNGH